MHTGGWKSWGLFKILPTTYENQPCKIRRKSFQVGSPGSIQNKLDIFRKEKVSWSTEAWWVGGRRRGRRHL